MLTPYAVITFRRKQSFDCSNPPTQGLKLRLRESNQETQLCPNNQNPDSGIETVVRGLARQHPGGSKQTESRLRD